MKINEVYTAYMSWGKQGKRRPVLILKNKTDSVVVFKITTKYNNKSDYIKSKYYKISDLKVTGLSKQSYIDTMSKYELRLDMTKFKRIGQLSTEDIWGLKQFISK